MVAIFVLSCGTTRFKGVGERAAPAFEFPVRNILTVGQSTLLAPNASVARIIVAQLCDVDTCKEIYANVVLSAAQHVPMGF